MKNSLLILLLIFCSFNWSYAQGLIVEKGMNDRYAQTILDVCVVGSNTYSVIDYNMDGVIIQKMDAQGNEIWNASLMQMTNNQTLFLNEMVVTNDGNLWLAGQGVLACDVPVFSYFVVCIDSNGSYVNHWPVPASFSAVPYYYGLSTTGNSKVAVNFRDGTLSEIYEFSPTQKVIVPNPSSKKFDGFARVNAANFYGYYDSTLYRMNPFGAILDSIYWAPFSQITQFDSHIYAIAGNDLFKATFDFNALYVATVGTSQSLSHLKVNSMSARCIENLSSEKHIITVDPAFLSVSSTTQYCTEPNRQLFDYDNSFSLLRDYSLTNFTAVRFQNYALNSATNSTVNRTDVAVIGMEIVDQSIQSIAPGNIFSVNAKVKVLVKNEGPNLLTSCRLNHYIGPSAICYETVTSIDFANLNVAPGDSIWIEMGWLGAYTNQVFNDSITREYCVYSSNPNGIVDLNVPNDKSCTTAFFGKLGQQEIPKNEFKIFPNPATSRVYVVSAGAGFYHYRLMNLVGEEVQKGDLLKGEIDLLALKEGMYILTILDGNENNRMQQSIVKL
ncbi:MAG: T9SS type A sorting domain-containing protein [Crocinitomicaceae bacterium]